MRMLGFAVVLVAVLAILPAGSARADLFLSLEPSSSTIEVGQTVMVDVLLSQDAVGTQVGASNPLLTAGIRLSFGSPAGIVGTGLGTIDYLFDWVAVAGFEDPSTITIALSSLAGFGDLTTPLLLARLTFTGLAAGTTLLQVEDLDDQSADFITLGDDVLDPTNVGTARITVRQPDGTIPEPSSLAMGLLAAGMAAAIAARRRRAVSA